MLASELIQELQKKIDAVGDQDVYVTPNGEHNGLGGYEELNVCLDADDNIVIDVKA
jgi:hypothetical protein